MPKRGEAGYLNELGRELYAAVLSDVLDEVGLRSQAMPPRLRPLDDSLVMVGFARTGRFAEVEGVTPGENPYELEIRIIDDLTPGDVMVFDCAGRTGSLPGASFSPRHRSRAARSAR